MFDKDGSGKLDEEEFYFLLQYLNIEIDEDTHEKMFRKYDKDKSGFIEFREFRMAWLRLANTRKELEDRGIPIPTLATKFQMIHMLEKVLEEEEEQERLALEETKRWQMSQDRLKVKRQYIVKAKTQAKVELCSALDAGGSVYVFGNGSLNQFNRAPRPNMNTPFFKQEGQELIQSLWSSRVGCSKSHLDQSLQRKTTLADDMKLSPDEDSFSSKDFILLDRDLNIQQNTVWLWGRKCDGVAISESVIVAFNEDGSLYSWGGNDQWWHQFEPDSCWQKRSRGDTTARSNDLLGCQPNWRSDTDQSGDQNNKHCAHAIVTDELAKEMKTVLQYFNSWSTPDGNVNLLDHAKKCLRGKIERSRIAQSLQLRGKNTDELTKADMVGILYKDILLEHKLLGEAVHLELKALDHEMVQFKQQRKMKLAKRRQFRFAEIWRPLRQAQRLDGSTLARKKESGGNQKADTDFGSTVGKQIVVGQDEDDSINTKRGIGFSGLTPRGPSPLSKSSSQRWKMIDAGANHAGLVDNMGRLWMWGLDSIGRLGRQTKKKEGQQNSSTSLHRFSPQPIKIDVVKQFSCGYSHTAAVSKAGNLLIWGSGSCGKLGLGDVTSTQECFSSIPVPLKCFSSNSILKVSCGSSHTACVDKDGGLWVWGSGGGGRLGLGHRSDVFSPHAVKTIEEPIVDVSCGNSQTLVISAINDTTDFCNKTKVRHISGGNLYVAGSAEVLGSTYNVFGTYNFFSSGGLDDCLEQSNSAAVPITHISAGFSHQSAVSLDGELYAWGDNTQGCCGQDAKVFFVNQPTKVALYNKPKDLAAGKSTYRSVPYGNQPFFDVDLGEVASIREIKLWNCLTVPDNPAIDKNTYTGRLFPCWVMVSHEIFPDSIGEGRLDAALRFSVVNKRFEENIHESVWKRKYYYAWLPKTHIFNLGFCRLQLHLSINSNFCLFAMIMM